MMNKKKVGSNSCLHPGGEGGPLAVDEGGTSTAGESDNLIAHPNVASLQPTAISHQGSAMSQQG